jgi:hypothetical protein
VDNQCLTRVILRFDENKRRHELLFGIPASFEEICGSLERHVFFTPGQVFGLEIWEANDYGTVRWILYILKSLAPGEKGSTLAPVSPGAEILFCVRGAKKVRLAHRWLRSLTDSTRALVSIDPDYYRASHFRFKLSRRPRDPYEPSGKIRDFLRNKT